MHCVRDVDSGACTSQLFHTWPGPNGGKWQWGTIIHPLGDLRHGLHLSIRGYSRLKAALRQSTGQFRPCVTSGRG